MTELTHFNQAGEAHMVNVGQKSLTDRIAIAEGWIAMQAATLNLVITGGHKKGDVLGIARVAGIMAAKKTSDLIPLCHSLLLTQVTVDLQPLPSENRVYCEAMVKTHGQTGVEMEALMAVQVTLLTIYDMCKAVDRGMVIENVQLKKKEGGKSGTWERNSP